MSIADRCREARERLGMSQAQLAKEITKLGFAIGQSAIGNLEAGKTQKPRFLHELSLVLKVSPQWLRDGKETSSAESAVTTVTAPAPSIMVPFPSDMARDVPVLGTATGGNGVVQMRDDPIDYVRRPPSLIGRADVFALYVEEMSMVPAFNPGDLVFVERRRPRIGDHAIIEFRDDPNGDLKVIIKRLAGVTARATRLQQYNPDKVVEIPTQHIVRMQRVMTMSDLFSV